MGGFVNELDDHFNKILQAAGYTSCCRRSSGAKNDGKNQTQDDRPHHGVHVNGPKSHLSSFSAAVSEAPGTVGQLPVGQVCQVMLNVIRCCFCAAAHCVFTVLILFVMSSVGVAQKIVLFCLIHPPRAFN